MPFAATLGHFHVCPRVNPGPVPHVGGPIAVGSPNVLINGMPAARVGDMAVCVGPPDRIAKGSTTVLINNKPAARMGDRTAHGGVIVTGMPNVLMGDDTSGLRNGSGVSMGGSTASISPPPRPAPEMPPARQAVTGDSRAAPPAATAPAAQAPEIRPPAPAQPTQSMAPLPSRSVIPTAPPPARAEAEAAPDALVQRAVRNTNSKGPNAEAEALGELGLEEYKQRSGIRDDPGFIKRYHGQDNLGRKPDDGLVGLEAKGSATGIGRISEREDGFKQLSWEANEQRAKQMVKKKQKGKVGKPSNRIGGSYTESEIELYQEIKDNGGRKDLVSTHTHTETGDVTVLKHDHNGKTVASDHFKIENFQMKKQQIKRLLGIIL